MDTDDFPIEAILAESRRFMVPLYQRKYQWDDSLLNRFWDDVEAKATEVLEGNARFQHYMANSLAALEATRRDVLSFFAITHPP